MIFGFSVLALPTYLFSDIIIQIFVGSIDFPGIISGFARGFGPLTTLAMGTLPNEQMGLRAQRIIPLLCLALIIPFTAASAQTTRPAKQSAKKQAQATNQLSKLREDYLKATKEYKASLAKLQAIYENNVRKAEEHLAQSKTLYSEGLISKSDLGETETSVAAAKDKVDEVRRQMATADTQIANTLVESEAEAQMAKSGRVAKGALIRTTSFIRYNGPAAWALSDAWKVQRFFLEAFKQPLPVAVFGQGAIHDRWHLDHRNAMDVSLNPDGSEGRGLMNFLRANGIPFLAFREAIPGTATGPHIHIGRPSHRY
jgi:hypothetical protein